MRESSQTDPAALELSRQFASMFSSFSGQLARVDPNVTANFSQSGNQAQALDATSSVRSDALERYSGIPSHNFYHGLHKLTLSFKIC